ncbi:hypothetical protein GOP47_0025636 [Adiantum capillus-veneris]|uniref:Embryonic stem cell-specific 5-hydroxymethylcytosine-binding protein n=1 Tax=Adiantum capillus-veneris TaxID=13818 RepID=A0A9D4Z3Q9_ADICA|nr:hypothetical protein GOP47_0025636 [Adiantum capillus-veneris]
MCGRARCTLRPEDVPAACGFNPPLQTHNGERFRSSYNISPGSYMPVIRHLQEESSKSPVVHYMKWGLVPSFTKKAEEPDHFRMFNARSESVHEKASFRKLLPRSRCLAVVEGFYEWKKDGPKKQPYYIHFDDGRPLVFAALFDCWTNSEGEALYTFTILTTCSSKALSWLHDRMPVILGDQQAIDNWLNVDQPYESLRAVMQPYEHQDLVWYPVTPAMGKTSYDGPECIKQLKVGGEPRNSLVQLFGKHKDSARPHSTKQAKREPSAEEEDMEGSMMDEKELKEFLAGVKPEEDVDLSNTGKEEVDMEKESKFVATTAAGISLDLKGTKMPKKRKSPEASPKASTKATTPASAKEGQRSLLAFFGKQ